MPKIILYHDPNSSVSRSALVYLEQERYQIKVVRYLEQPLTVGKFSSLVKKIGLPAIQLIDPEKLKRFKFCIEHLQGLPDEQLINLIAEHPQLLIAPILQVDKQAVVALSKSHMQRILPVREYIYPNRFIMLSY